MVENREAREELLSLAKEFLGGRREGWHVSDLLYPRRAYWERKQPQPLSDLKTLYFLAGRGHHEILQMVSAMPEYREVRVKWAGITGTIDVFRDVPVEIKTTRAGGCRDAAAIERDHPEWIRQLRYYCAMLGQPRGQLWVLGLGGKGELPDLRVYDVEVDDLDKIRLEMIRIKEALERALEAGNPEVLPPCPAWMCRSCEYRENFCQPLSTVLERSLEVTGASLERRESAELGA